MKLKFILAVICFVFAATELFSPSDLACVVTRRTVRSYGYILPVGSAGKNGPKLSDDDLITFEEGTEVADGAAAAETANANGKNQRRDQSPQPLTGPAADAEDVSEYANEKENGRRHGNRGHFGRGRSRDRLQERRLKNRGRGRHNDDDDD